MPTATPNYLPQGERLLEGTITSGQLSAAATSCDVSNPPSADKLPTYFEFEPDNVDNRETVRVTDVSGSTITFERGVYNSGTGKIHASNSAYKQKWTEKHIEAIADAIQDGWVREDTSLTLTRDSATQFTITGIDHTAYYTDGRLVRFNGSDANVAVVSSSSLSGSDTVVTLKSSYSIPATLTTVEIATQPRGGTDVYNNTFSELVDSNGNETIKTPATTSAVNELTVKNAATGTPVEINATGDDTNISIEINPKGTGVVKSKVTIELRTTAVDSDMETGDGQAGFRVPKELDGMNLVAVAGYNDTAGTTGTNDTQIRRVRSGSPVDMLSTKLTIDSTETDSSTAATAAVIDTSNDDVSEGDKIYVDIDAVQTTAAKGHAAQLTFANP